MSGSKCQYADDVGMPEYRCVDVCQYAWKASITDAEIQDEAEKIIQIAMGRDTTGKTLGRKRVWRANEDPLAFILGVEAIVSLVKRASTPSTN